MTSTRKLLGWKSPSRAKKIDFPALEEAITRVGAALHSIDEVVAGDRMVEHMPRSR